MKLPQTTIDFLINVVQAARELGMERIQIEPNNIRGLDEHQTVSIFDESDTPTIPYNAIHFVRLDVLIARYNIIKDSPDFSMEVFGDKNDEYPLTIKMKSKSSSIDYKCGKPMKTLVPRDKPRFKVPFTPESVQILQKSMSAISSESVTINSNNGVSFEITDVNNDSIKHVFATEDQVENLADETNKKFVHSFSRKKVLTVLNTNPSPGYFIIGAKGTLNVQYRGLSVYILPDK